MKIKLPKCNIFLYNWWEIDEVKKFCSAIDKNAIGHAGTIETALGLHLFSNKVHRKYFNREYNYVDTKTGIIDSDQTVATRLMGKRVFGLIIKGILKEIQLNNKNIST